MGGCLGISNETILDTRKEPQRDKHKGYQWGREIGALGGLIVALMNAIGF